MSKLYATIDPALNNTGLALWDSDWSLISVRSLATQGQTLGKAYQLRNWVEGKLAPINGIFSRVYIEYPKYFANSPIGQAAAARGDLSKTLMAAHICMCVAWEIEAEPIFVPVNEWKGQLTKQATQLRVDKLLSKVVLPYRLQPSNSHEYDAIGIGLYLKGEF